MTDLESAMHRLEKPEPDPRFLRASKERLMYRIADYEQEAWFVRLLASMRLAVPSQVFVQQARVRLLSRLAHARQPMIAWWGFARRALASTLAMTIAVTATLLTVGGKQPVSAADNSFLEPVAGEVTIKHPDQLVWNAITEPIELQAGDLIRLGEDGVATIQFFDDTLVRLDGGSVLLISRLDVSKADPRQGTIETSLHQGRAWVQTLNADDGFAGLRMYTRDLIVSALNASFDVAAQPFEPTLVRVFRRGVTVDALDPGMHVPFAGAKIGSLQRITFDAATLNRHAPDVIAALATDLTDEDRMDAWAESNIVLDRDHLALVRDRELASLESVAGTLPGDVLYPLKRTRERLMLALRFDQAEHTNALADLANQRLNESILLIRSGETERAQKALSEYQELVARVTEARTLTPIGGDGDLSRQIVTPHEKTLLAALQGDANMGIVKKVLNQTEELLAEGPAKLAEVRLKNDLENLAQVHDLVSEGNLSVAQVVLQDTQSAIPVLDDEESLDDDTKKTVYSRMLDTQNEKKRILSEIERELTTQSIEAPIVELVRETHRNLKEEIRHTAAVIRPFEPDVVLSASAGLSADERVIEFVDKVNIYSTFTGQSNQIKRLFKQHPQYAHDMDFLVKVRPHLSARAQDVINAQILDLQRTQVELKSKLVKQKIDRAKREREKREGQ